MTDENRQILAALSMDLKRAALGHFRNSHKTADRFLEEALKRSGEVKTEHLKPYLVTCLQRISELSRNSDKTKVAEDALI